MEGGAVPHEGPTLFQASAFLWHTMTGTPCIAHPLVRYLLALLWFLNGLWSKVLDKVPRHQQIVSEILGPTHAPALTTAIGVAEIAMALWIVVGWRYRLCANLQITVILLMNLIEFFLVPHLLVWGRLNLLFAVVLCAIIHLNARTVDTPDHA